MRIYQKEVESYLRQTYSIPFNELLIKLKNITPGYVEIYLVETKKDELFGEIEVYQIFNQYEKSKDYNKTYDEVEWNDTYDVFLEFWKISNEDGTYTIK